MRGMITMATINSGVDPHAWLDPENARRWLDVIAEELSEHDPDNAATYADNAEAAKAAIAATQAEIRASLRPVSERPYVVFHDAYQYFERRFGLSPVGAISVGDASDPSPAHVAEIRDAAADQGAVCVFAEPQFNPGLVTAIAASGEVKTAVIDPLGSTLELGPNFYVDMLHGIEASMLDCLK